jgi:hypothetical protein
MFSNRQSFRRGPRASTRHHRCTNRSGRSARTRFGRAGFQPRREPVGSTLQSTGATRPPFGGLFAEPSDRFAQADPVRLFPVSIFDFPSSAVAFLIRYQQLEINVNHSKQSTETISNPQNPRYLETKKGAIPRRKKRSVRMTTGTEATAKANQGCPAEAGRFRRNDSRLAFILPEALWGRFESAGSKGARGCTILLFSLLRGMVTGND